MTSNPSEPAVRQVSAVAEATADLDVEALVRAAQNGCSVSFDRLVNAFSGPIYNLACRMTGNVTEAEELTQEVFVKLYRVIGKYGGQSKFSTWLFALAINHCRSGLRKIRRIAGRECVRLDQSNDGTRPPPETVDPGVRPDDALMRREVREQIETAIAGLPRDFRVVIVLRDLQGLAYEEVAAALGCSVGTVKSRLARARLRVKTRLIGEGILE